MSTIMRTQVVKIGNSQGIRIPKLLLDQLKLGTQVELEAIDGHLEVRSTRVPRQGWEKQAEEMVKLGEDRIPDWEALPPTDWDLNEWEW